MGWYNLGEAAELIGIKPKTLKRRADNGKHKVRPHPSRGRYRQYWVDEPVSPGQTFIEEAVKRVQGYPDYMTQGFVEVAAPQANAATVTPAPIDFPHTPPIEPKISDPLHVYRVASIWDVHVPEHDEQAFESMLKWLRDYQPECFVIGGDFMELSSMSQHGGDPNPPKLTEEIDAGRRVLYRLRDALPNAKIVYLEGNHETRHERKITAHMPELYGVNTIPELLHLNHLGIHWFAYQEMWRPRLPSGNLGKLHYTHGKWANKHHAAKHLDQYGVSTRYGHTHKPQVFTRGYADGAVRIGVGSPCMRTLDTEWAGPYAGWCHGFGVDEFMPDGTFTVQNIVMVNRRFAYNGKVYAP